LSYVGRERHRWGYYEISRSSSRPASPATVHHYGRVVKTLFNWAEDEEYPAFLLLIAQNGQMLPISCLLLVR